MSQAEELLNSVTPYTANSATEPHIVVGADRVITVPEELKRIAVQHDHMIETVTFDCPRYWDEHDMSKMLIYVNYMREDAEKGSDLATNITIDENDESIMHFDWTITGHLAAIHGPVVFLVCIQKMNSDGTSANHWNSELNKDLYVSEGLEVESSITAVYPGIITQLLTRMDNVEAKTTDEAIAGYVEDYINNSDTNVDAIVEEHMTVNGQKYVNYNMDEHAEEYINKHMDENAADYIKDYLTNYTEDEKATAGDITTILGKYFPSVTLTVGDSFTLTESELSTNQDCCTHVFDVYAGMAIDFTQSTHGGPRAYTYGDRLVVVNSSNIIVDLVPFDTLTIDGYTFNVDGKAYLSVLKPYGLQGSDVLFVIKNPLNLLKEVSNKADKDELKSHILYASKTDEYLNDASAGDAALEAILSGKQILVRVPNADGGIYTAIYSPVLMYQLPNFENNYLYLFYFNDGVNDMGLPSYSQLKMLLSTTYNETPLE